MLIDTSVYMSGSAALAALEVSEPDGHREWNPTPEQARAISARGRDILVSAAAGSGKTKVLVERVISLLREGASLRDMLIVTFTRLAAAEMKDRLRKTLMEEAKADGEIAEWLHGQIMWIDAADICTIDSYCANLLRRHFSAVSVDPLFKHADAATLAELTREAMDAALTEWYEIEENEPTPLSVCLTPQENADMARKLYGFIMARPEPWKWLDAAIEGICEDADGVAQSGHMRLLMDALRRDLTNAASRFETLAIEAENMNCERYAAQALDDARCVQKRVNALGDGRDAYVKAVDEFKFTRLVSAKTMEEKAYKDQFKKHRDSLKNRIDSQSHLVIMEDPIFHAVDNALMKRQLSSLAELTRLYHARFTKLKSDRSLLDFTDTAQKTYEALCDPAIAAEERNRYAHVFCDEYQDSSPLQDAILRRVSRGDNIFLVGDVKQSIYRFRDADPSMFISKYKSYKHDAYDTNTEGIRIDLDTNFRSTRPIIYAINELFRRLLSRDHERLEIIYDDASSMNYHREADMTVIPELHIVNASRSEEAMSNDDDRAEWNEDADEEGDGKDAEEQAELSAVEIEAGLAAEKIRELVNSGYKYSDIAILMRSVRSGSSYAPAVARILQKHSIPAIYGASESFLSSPDVLQIIGILRMIDNPYDDLAVLAALRSPACGLTDEEMARVRVAVPSGRWHKAAGAYTLRMDDELSRRLLAFLESVDNWRFDSMFMRVSDLISNIVSDTNWLAIKAPKDKSENVANSIQELIDLADECENGSQTGLRRFLRVIDDIGKTGTLDRRGNDRKAGGDAGAADAVRLLTIHASKGLEFPVCIVLGLGARFNENYKRDRLQAHSKYGLAMHVFDEKYKAYKQTMQRQAIITHIGIESLAEDARILYVALTRAKDRLILFGTAKNLREMLDASHGDVPDEDVLSAKSFLEWIVMSLRGRPEFLDARKQADMEPLGDERPMSGQTNYWKMFIHHAANIANTTQPQSERDEMDEQTVRLADVEIYADTYYSFTPPVIKETTATPLKTSVTALSHTNRQTRPDAELGPYAPILKEDDHFSARPMFARETFAPTAAERGTATHMLLSRFNIETACQSPEQAIEECEKSLVEKGLLPRSLLTRADRASAVALIESPIGQRMLRSNVIRREIPFNLRNEANAADTITLIQGIIDCCFIEESAWILLDYKTDRVTDAEILLERYREQVELYARALRELTSADVREAYLYSLALGKPVRIE